MPDPEDRVGRMWKDLSEAESQHLSFQQLEAYVDERLDPTERELVSAHSELCEQCVAELRDLERFAASLRSREEEPVILASGPRWLEWIRIPRHAWALAAAAAVLAIVVAVGLRPSGTASSPTASVQTPAPPASPSPSGAATTAPPPNEVASSAAVSGSSPATRDPRTPGTGASPANPPVETLLEAPRGQLGLKSSQRAAGPYRVLSSADRIRYELELQGAPDDPEARAAIDIKYGLYNEAEKEYQKLIDTGGEKTEKGQRLMDALKRLRGH